MSKILTRVAIATALALSSSVFLTACAGEPAPKVDSLTVWVDELEAKSLEQTAKDFEADTGVKINLVVESNARGDFLSKGNTAETPDVVAGAHDWIGDLVANQVVEPIDLGGRAGDYQDNAVAAFKYDGKNYGLPSTVQSLALICDAKKVPNQPTWEEVKKVGLALSLNAGGGDAYHLYTIQTSFGAHVFKKDGSGNYLPELEFENGGAEFAKWLAGEGASVLDPKSTWDSSVAAMQKGTKGCWITGPWVSGILDLTTNQFNIYSVPSVGGKESVSFLSARGFYVASHSKDTYYATKFVLDYVGKSETQKELFNVSGRIPANKSAFDSAKSDRMVQGFGKAGVNAEPLPAIPAMASVWASWGSTEMAIISGKVKPDVAWAQMVADIKSGITK